MVAEIKLATPQDLAAIAGWLHAELETSEDDCGFFHGIDIIRAAQHDDKLFCMPDEITGLPLAFCAMEKDGITPCILCVRREEQRRGHGGTFVRWALHRAYDAGACALHVQVLRESFDFWTTKMGFTQFPQPINSNPYVRYLFEGRDIARADGRSVLLDVNLFQKDYRRGGGGGGDGEYYDRKIEAAALLTARYMPAERRIYLDREWIVTFALTWKGLFGHDDDVWIEVAVREHRTLERCVWYHDRVKSLADFSHRSFGVEIPLPGVFCMRHFDLRASECRTKFHVPRLFSLP